MDGITVIRILIKLKYDDEQATMYFVSWGFPIAPNPSDTKAITKYSPERYECGCQPKPMCDGDAPCARAPVRCRLKYECHGRDNGDKDFDKT